MRGSMNFEAGAGEPLYIRYPSWKRKMGDAPAWLEAVDPATVSVNHLRNTEG
jgi:hypothetical protein